MDTNEKSRLNLEHNHSGDHCPACETMRQREIAKLQRWDRRRECAAKIEQVQLLHAMFVPPAAIATRLNLDEKTARYVIQRGTWPQAELFGAEVAE